MEHVLLNNTKNLIYLLSFSQIIYLLGLFWATQQFNGIVLSTNEKVTETEKEDKRTTFLKIKLN